MNAHKYAGMSILFIVFLWFGPAYSFQTCTSDGDCPQGWFCDVVLPPNPGLCYQCDFSHACPSGQICVNNQCITPECKAHCDCPQGSFCYYGKCLTDPKTPVYCCTNPGCQPGRWCFEPNGGKGTCDEQPDYACQSACDCGPVHACLDIPGVGKRCIKDLDDPWNPGGTALFGATVPPGEPTYCCSDPLCHAGRYAYGTNVANFACFDLIEQASSNFCGGPPCLSACDCDPGQSCLDTHVTGTVPPVGDICSPKRGQCVSNAVAEAVYGASPAELIPCCGKGCFPGQKCEIGWRPGGAYLFQRIVGVCAGACSTVCFGENLQQCLQDCGGNCGNGICSGWKTPKNCPSDCPVVCGDGSCYAGEVTSCPQDCGCPDSPTFPDYYSYCGDGFCDPNPLSLENCVNCPHDCSSICPQPVVTKDAKTSLKRTYHWSINKTADQNALTLALSQSFPLNYAVSVNETYSDTWSVNGNISIFNPANISTVIKGVSDEMSGVGAAAVTCGVTFPYSLASKGTLTCTYEASLPDASTRTNIATATTPTAGGTASVSGAASIDFADAAILAIDPCVSVTDDKKGNLGTVCNSAAPKTFTYSLSAGPYMSVGTYAVVNTASLTTDTTHTTGNTSWTVNVNVHYSFMGFLPPVDNPPVMNTAKAGQTIPVKWQLPDGKGGYVSDLGAVANITFQQTACSDLSAALTSEVTEASSGGSGLHYDAAANQFVYNWKTSLAMAEKCYVLTLRLNDGRQYQANLSLK